MITASMLATAALVTLVAMLVLARSAPALGLLDHPDGVRKHHAGAVPLIGGPAILLALIAVMLLFPQARTYQWWILLTISAMSVGIGLIDDRFELTAIGRLIMQLVLGAFVVYVGGVHITHFGDLAGTGHYLPLGWTGPIISVLALAAAMNAFNMLDGTDGQAASVAWITSIALVASAVLAQAQIPIQLTVLLGALPVYLIFNLVGNGGRIPKAFLGDSGALMLGMLMGWALIQAAQSPGGWARPVTVLWFAMVPLFDTLYVMSYRIMKRQSPFAPDRNHIHHLLVDHGFSRLGALMLVVVAASSFAGAGLAMEFFRVPEMLMFIALFAAFLAYIAAAAWLHRHRDPLLATGERKAIKSGA